jgi:hypothetical protein
MFLRVWPQIRDLGRALAALACIGASVVDAEDRGTGISLADVSRQLAAARTAAEAEDASLEDRIRFATWALMVAELAMEPHGLVSTASDLFAEGQDALGELQDDLAADPEAEKALVVKAPLLIARLDAAVVRQERIAARRELARGEERDRLNQLRSIATSFRTGMAAQSEAQAWAALGDASKAETTLAETWNALAEIDRTISERRDFFLMDDEPDIEESPDATLITVAPTTFRSAAVVANAKAVAAIRLLSSIESDEKGLYGNPDAPAILKKAIAWADAALTDDANPPSAPKGASSENVFALYARARATVLAATLRSWETPFNKAIGQEVATALQQAAADCRTGLAQLGGHKDSSLHTHLTRCLDEIESPDRVRARIADLVDARMMERAVTEARSLAMLRSAPDFVAVYLDTARRAGRTTSDLREWCRKHVVDGASLEPVSSTSLRIAIGRLTVEAAANRMTSPDWHDSPPTEKQEVAREAMVAHESLSTPAGASENDAARLSATRALLTAYAWLASPDAAGGKACLESAVEDARNAEVNLSRAIVAKVGDDEQAEVLEDRESLFHCRMARGFLAIALLPEYRDEARLAFAAAIDEAGRLPSGGHRHAMLGSPLLTSLLRASGEGAAAKLVAEERSTRQSMTRFVEACFAMEFGAPSQAAEQFRIAQGMADRRSGDESVADAASLMRAADGFDVAITLPESMAAFELLGLVASGDHDQSLRRAVALARQQAARPNTDDIDGKPTDFELLVSDMSSVHSPLIAYAILRALDARLDGVALGQDEALAKVLMAMQACHEQCKLLLDTARQRDRYPHLVDLVADLGRQLNDARSFESARDLATIEKGLRRHPTSGPLWNRYLDEIDQTSRGGTNGVVSVEKALAVLDSLAADPRVPSAALAITRAALLERLARYPLAQEAYASARRSGMTAEERVIAASREAVLMVRNAFPFDTDSTGPKVR